MEAHLILACLHSVKASDRYRDYNCPVCLVRREVIHKTWPAYKVRCMECRYTRKGFNSVHEANRRAHAHWRKTNHEVSITDEMDVTESLPNKMSEQVDLMSSDE